MMCCYYPTTTVAIDDDKDFLNILTQNIGITDCTPYSSPKNAIKALKSQNPLARLQQRILKADSAANEAAPEDHAIHYNMRGLHEEIYNNDRFKDVSVIIVDYYMDEMNGIEVCEALSSHPAKKILLTGGADKEKLAIDAFNRGVIHKFINKSDHDFPVKLKQAVHVLKDAYFRDLSLALIPNTATMTKNLYQFPPFINFARSLIDQSNAIEYYMVDTVGTCLMLDTNGKPSWFIVRHEDDMKSFEKLARDMEAPKHYIVGIKERLMMPFFFSEEDYQHPVSEWKQFFHPCTKLQGVKNYYHTIFEGTHDRHISRDKIRAYSSRLQHVMG